MNKFNVGDSVTIVPVPPSKRTIKVPNDDYETKFIREMDEFCGKTAKVIQVHKSGTFRLDISSHFWHPDWLVNNAPFKAVSNAPFKAGQFVKVCEEEPSPKEYGNNGGPRGRVVWRKDRAGKIFEVSRIDKDGDVWTCNNTKCFHPSWLTLIELEKPMKMTVQELAQKLGSSRNYRIEINCSGLEQFQAMYQKLVELGLSSHHDSIGPKTKFPAEKCIEEGYTRIVVDCGLHAGPPSNYSKSSFSYEKVMEVLGTPQTPKTEATQPISPQKESMMSVLFAFRAFHLGLKATLLMVIFYVLGFLISFGKQQYDVVQTAAQWPVPAVNSVATFGSEVTNSSLEIAAETDWLSFGIYAGALASLIVGGYSTYHNHKKNKIRDNQMQELLTLVKKK